MRQDMHGLPISTDSAEAAEAFDCAVLSYLKYRTDAPTHLGRALAQDPEFGLAHCLQGYLAMTSFKLANVPLAAEAARRARQQGGAMSAREWAHVDALDAWIAGDLDRTLAIWSDVLAAHPADIVAFRLAHFVNFWLGRPQAMRASAEQTLRRSGVHMPGYGTLLSCLCFACEECGDYAAAEPAGWRALEIDRADFWGTHALAHVMEMQGRHGDGIALMEESERHWDGGNNLLHHLSWHRALFHLERREFDAALDLYDRRFRNLASPLTMAIPDLYIDVQNAASMLFRLERLGVDVGDRWEELADKGEARADDCLSAFTLPHWMMAFAATGRDGAATRLLQAMGGFAAKDGAVSRIVGETALPVSRAVLAHAKGDHRHAVDLMTPALATMHELGGSHAQQEVLLQLYLDAAMRAGRDDEARAILARAAAGRMPPLAQRVAYTDAARRYAQ